MNTKETTTPLTKEQVYAKYVLMAKARMNKESLAKKQRRLTDWLVCIWLILILFTLLVYTFISGFSFSAFQELVNGTLGYWTIAGALFLGMIFVLIVETRKPDFIKFDDICKEAEKLILEVQKNLKITTTEISLLEIKAENEL